MKINKILDTAAKTFAGVKLGGKKSDPKLAELDRGVLSVGLLVAALDGTIEPEEYAAFDTLARKCRGGSAKNVRALLDSALPAAGQLMAMAQVGAYSEKDRLVAFLAAAKKALPRGFAGGSMADVRRAFALWVAMGIADGEFSAVEKSAIRALFLSLAVVRAKKTKKGAAKAFGLLEEDFFAKAEKITRDLANASKKVKAEAALEELIATVQVIDEKGKEFTKPASGIAVKLAVLSALGIMAAGSAKAETTISTLAGENWGEETMAIVSSITGPLAHPQAGAVRAKHEIVGGGSVKALKGLTYLPHRPLGQSVDADDVEDGYEDYGPIAAHRPWSR